MTRESNQAKSDNRSDNKDKLQEIVQNTLENIHEAEEAIPLSNEEEQQSIASKNKRREESIDFLRSEIHDEAPFSEE